MSEDHLSVTGYEERNEEAWDKFVMEESVNGTFLQSRRFLNYHPAGRFQDASYIVWNGKGEIVAVCPACRREDNGEQILYSHMGSTYGGVIIRNGKWYKTHRVIEIVTCLEEKWQEDGINRVLLKQTPSLLASQDQDLTDYCLYYLGYETNRELNLYVDLTQYSDDILTEFSQGKRTNVHNCEKEGLTYRAVREEEEIQQFYALLAETLQKYDKKPVHTVEELQDFISRRLREECEIFGVYKEDQMIAGSMMFYFHQAKAAHTQYLCADARYNRLSPMTYAYYAMLCEMRKRGFEKVSWGIVTEDMGRYLNDGLTSSKEAFGSRHAVDRTYLKKISR